MVKQLQIEEFIVNMGEGVLIDVRTPAEYEKAHIPGAFNLPIFTNDERAAVGTLYKQKGREPAILKGLEIVGPKMKSFIQEAENLSGKQRKLYLYCWRGGMRSGSMAWLLDLYGFDVYVLKRGYKAFRNFVLEIFREPRELIVLGGKTGSGKTMVLKALERLGENIIDLEGLAHHKGSAYGTIGEHENCSQEFFENKLGMAWLQAASHGATWVEDESRSIGKKIIPEPVWEQMRSSEVVKLEKDKDSRVDFLVEVYGKVPKEELFESTHKIKKRLGGDAFKKANEAIASGDLGLAAGILLEYYDKAYQYGISQRDPATIHIFETRGNRHDEIASDLLNFVKQYHAKISGT